MQDWGLAVLPQAGPTAQLLVTEAARTPFGSGTVTDSYTHSFRTGSLLVCLRHGMLVCLRRGLDEVRRGVSGAAPASVRSSLPLAR